MVISLISMIITDITDIRGDINDIQGKLMTGDTSDNQSKVVISLISLVIIGETDGDV